MYKLLFFKNIYTLHHL